MRGKSKGFTILELLIAIIIMGILVAIIIPLLAGRAELARKKAAMTDLELIQKGMETVGIDTGYYFRLHVLDDTRGGDLIGFSSPPDPLNPDIIDGVRDEFLNSYAQNPTRLFIGIESGGFKINFAEIYNRLVQNETNFGWNGPYLNWMSDLVDADGNPYPDDVPDDPWGHNYLFFTKWGLVKEPEGLIWGSEVGLEKADVVSQFMGADCNVFDRFTILSLGSDGLPGPDEDGNPRFGTGDDIFRQF